MALNLVSAYGSDSEQSGDEDFFSKPATTTKDDDDEEIPEYLKDPPVCSSKVEISSDSSEDDEKDEEERETTTRKRKSGDTVRLDSGFKSSIFNNVYDDEVHEHNEVLSRHVKLADAAGDTKKLKRKACRNFLKGRCKLGKKCKFDHPDRSKTDSKEEGATMTTAAKLYTGDEPEVFQSKKFKSS